MRQLLILLMCSFLFAISTPQARADNYLTVDLGLSIGVDVEFLPTSFSQWDLYDRVTPIMEGAQHLICFVDTGADGIRAFPDVDPTSDDVTYFRNNYYDEWSTQTIVTGLENTYFRDHTTGNDDPGFEIPITPFNSPLPPDEDPGSAYVPDGDVGDGSHNQKVNLLRLLTDWTVNPADLAGGSFGGIGSIPDTEYQFKAGDLLIGFNDGFTGNSDYEDFVVVAQQRAVPLPGAVWLLGSGLVGLIGFRRLRRS